MPYVPDRGDVVWIQMNPQAGREQAGHRPAFVISPKAYNGKVGLALLCPITSKEKGYPFEVRVEGRSTRGVILADQVKSLDWRARGARFEEHLDESTTAHVLAKLETLVA
ncbi:MAG TPA: endoribonuclease MazF [Kiritimatiellia bacterium]|nr:endoribonuclease MazF [Kiritimatiellia bacterium]